MIVCLCKVVSDRDIHGAIDGGAASVRDVARACGAGTGNGCGGCHGALRAILRERQAQISLASASATGYLPADEKEETE